MITFTDQSSKMVEVDFLPNKKADTVLNSFKSYLICCETTFLKKKIEFTVFYVSTAIEVRNF